MTELFHGVVYSTTIVEYEQLMSELKLKNIKTYNWLNEKDPISWINP